jgi:hypothetical protein
VLFLASLQSLPVDTAYSMHFYIQQPREEGGVRVFNLSSPTVATNATLPVLSVQDLPVEIDYSMDLYLRQSREEDGVRYFRW